MPIINTLGKYFSQKDEFNQWQKDQGIKEEQRKKYLDKKQFTPEELATAKKLGTRIIDTVDIMDGKSEQASQDVEFATSPLPSLASIAGLASGGGISYLLWKSFDKKQEEQKKQFREFISAVSEKLPAEEKSALENFKSGKESLNEKNINNLEFLKTYDKNGKKIIAEQAKETAKTKNTVKNWLGKFKKVEDKTVVSLHDIMIEYSNKIGTHVGSKKLFGLLKYPTVGFVVAYAGASVWATKLQIQSSRIARYQARKNLNDDKNFVIYNDEQINKAKEIVKNMPEAKEVKKRGYFGRLNKLVKDNKSAKEETKTTKYSLNSLDLSSDEVNDIQNQQQVLNRTVSIINSNAETYSANMDTAANMILGGSVAGGAAIGAGVNWILDKMKVAEKFMNGFMKRLEANVQKGNCNSFLESTYISLKNPQVMKFVMGAGKMTAFAGIGGILTTIATSPLILMLNKNASRAGRFSAKKDLEKDPENFIYIDDKELVKIKDVKVKKKSPFSSFTSMFKVVPKSLVELFEYKKYQKTNLKDKQKFAEALKQVDVTPEQLKEAKKLKVSVFNTFESIDNNTEVLSEDIDTFTDVLQQVMPLGFMGAMAVPAIALTNGILKGKVSTGTILKKVTSFFGESTKALNSKFFKNQIRHISNGFTDTLDKKFNHILNNKYNFRSLLANIGNDQRSNVEKFIVKNQMTDAEIESLVKSIGNNKNSGSVGSFNALLKDFDLDNKFNIPIGATDEETIIMMKKYLRSDQKTNLVDISKKTLGEYVDDFNNSEKVQKLDTFKSYLNNFKTDEELQNHLRETVIPKINVVLGKKNEDKIPESIVEDVLSTFDKLEGKFAEHMNDNAFSAIKILKEDEKVKKLLDFLGLDNFDGLEKCKNETSVISKLIENNPAFIQKLQKRTGTVAEWGVDTAKAFASEDLIQSYIKDKKLLQDFSKDDVIKVSKDVIKIFNNIPASEISNLVSKLVRYQSENPQKMEILVKNLRENNAEGIGQLSKDLLITPDIKKAIIATGAGFLAANTFVSYLITAFFANMQLKAGRLGTMNAVKSLSQEAQDLSPDNSKPAEKPQTDKSEKSVLTLIDDFLKSNAAKVV